jgi:hypothetical protein
MRTEWIVLTGPYFNIIDSRIRIRKTYLPIHTTVVAMVTKFLSVQKYDPSSSYVEISPVRLKTHLYFPQVWYPHISGTFYNSRFH